MPSPSKYWTDSRVTQLQSLWTEGLSASLIARRMGGVTRNAVIGKLHRMGMRGVGGRPIQPIFSVPRKPRLTVVTPMTPMPEAPEPLSIAVESLTMKHCRYPYGNDAPYTFCGHPVAKAGESWCEFHRRVVFSKGASPEDIAKAIAAREASLLRKSGLG